MMSYGTILAVRFCTLILALVLIGTGAGLEGHARSENGCYYDYFGYEYCETFISPAGIALLVIGMLLVIASGIFWWTSICLLRKRSPKEQTTMVTGPMSPQATPQGMPYAGYAPPVTYPAIPQQTYVNGPHHGTYANGTPTQQTYFNGAPQQAYTPAHQQQPQSTGAPSTHQYPPPSPPLLQPQAAQPNPMPNHGSWGPGPQFQSPQAAIAPVSQYPCNPPQSYSPAPSMPEKVDYAQPSPSMV